ncbi:RNA-splicing factor [Coemansia erecta]|uniref:RNA-splicing factor n=1 Tax=Coemansia erecta TaxID=147472 RepID=A0A9W8CRQ2_9FUNG|nr:RNA-splicing factor [Coemansia erecta]
MYNGIGLNTPRGSGTSGHVVRNASALRPGQSGGTNRKGERYSRDAAPKSKHIDQGIIEHERKRQVEVKCLELQDKLEDQGLPEDEVEEQVDKYRQQLLKNLDNLDASGGKAIKAFETHKIAEAKSRENKRMASALRIDGEYVEGEAFDKELQELKRQKRMLEREKERARELDGSESETGDSDSGSDDSRSYRNSESESEGSSHTGSGGSSDGEIETEAPPKDTPPARPARPVEDGEPGEIEESSDEAEQSD